MIHKFSIRNFKCFKSINLSELSRFNIIVGSNAGGKTALLEALFFMVCTTAQKLLMHSTFRGMGPEVQISTEPDSFSALWRNMFFNFDFSVPISLEAVGSENHSRSLVISREEPKEIVMPFGNQGNQPDKVSTPTMNFQWTTADRTKVSAAVKIGPDGVNFGPVVESFPAIFFTPAFREPVSEDAKRFSKLSKAGNHKYLIEAVRQEFPFITNLSLEYHGGSATIHASLRSTNEKTPLSFVSEGINKFATILLALESFRRGIVLVDEIENGFYFDRMESMTRVLLELAKRRNTQLFVTTHSLEYLRAILPVVEESPEAFRLLRTTKDNGTSDVESFDGHHMAAAITEGLEIR